MSTPSAGARRLFFALWPDHEVRAQLAEVAQRWTRRPVAEANLHITLLFLGERSGEERHCFCEAASHIRSEPFDLQLDYLGGWPRAGIQWLGTSQTPRVLLDFVGGLAKLCEPCGYQAEKRRFVPHVTLSRNVKKPMVRTGLDVIRWEVRDYVLLESLPVQGGVKYEVLERWPLERNIQGDL